MHLLQCCNVGDICGGTAACAWSLQRSLPHWRHTVLFFTRPTKETLQAFRGSRALTARVIDEGLLQSTRPDLIVLHNTPPQRWEADRGSGAAVVQYVHSVGSRAGADVTLACSRWLAEQIAGPVPVLYQPISRPPRPTAFGSRELASELIVGRICTPSRRKWDDGVVALYDQLRRRFPEVFWEFVGAPDSVAAALRRAVGGRARFFPAGWSARSQLWRWHALLYHHPTLTESFGRTCAEAMRAGCIPIVDGRGGFVEQVDSGVSGFLCESSDDFSAALCRIFDAGTRLRMSRAARQQADDRFSLQSFVGQFATVLAERSAGGPLPAAAGGLREARR